MNLGALQSRGAALIGKIQGLIPGSSGSGAGGGDSQDADRPRMTFVGGPPGWTFVAIMIVVELGLRIAAGFFGLDSAKWYVDHGSGSGVTLILGTSATFLSYRVAARHSDNKVVAAAIAPVTPPAPPATATATATVEEKA